MLLDLEFWAFTGNPPPPEPPMAADVQVWLGGYDLTGVLHTVGLVGARAEVPDPVTGEDIVATYPGVESIDAMVSGVYTAGASEPPATVAPRIFTPANVAEWPLTILPPLGPGASGAEGNVAYNVRSAQLGMGWGGEDGELLPFSLSSRARTGLLDRCMVMAPKATRTASLTGTTYPLGLVTPSTKLVVVLHVFSVAGGGGSVTCRVESGTFGMPSPTTRATFAAVATASGVGRGVAEVTAESGDGYWRVVADWTPGSSYVLAAAAAMVAR